VFSNGSIAGSSLHVLDHAVGKGISLCLSCEILLGKLIPKQVGSGVLAISAAMQRKWLQHMMILMSCCGSAMLRLRLHRALITYRSKAEHNGNMCGWLQLVAGT
jgi:hypothetical protein